MVYRGSGERLEYDFLVAPGADPEDIALAFTGGRVSLARNGDLLVHARGGTLRQKRPFAYQRVGGVTRKVPSRFILEVPRPRDLRARPLRPLAAAGHRPAARLLDLHRRRSPGRGTGRARRRVRRGRGGGRRRQRLRRRARRTRSRRPVSHKGADPGHASGGGIDAVVTKVNPAGERHRVLDLPRRRWRRPRLRRGGERRRARHT